MFKLNRNTLLLTVFTIVLILAVSVFSLTITEQIIHQINPSYQIMTQFLTSLDDDMQVFAPYLLATVLILSFCVPIFLAYFKLIRKHQNHTELETGVNDLTVTAVNFNYKKILCIAVAIFIFIEAYQHFRFSSPIGTDARIYVYWLETISQGASQLGLWRIINLLPTILTFSVFFPFRFAGVSWDVIIKFVPLILGIMYLFVVFYFVKKNTSDLKLASISVLFAALSLHTLVLSTVLFNNLLGLSMMFLFFTFYMNYLATRQKGLIPLCFAILLFICIQHATTAIFLTVTIILFNIVKLVYNFKNGLNTIKDTLKLYIPIPIIILLLDLLNFCLYGKLENPIIAYIPTLIEGNFSVSSMSPIVWITTFQQYWQQIFLENLFLLIFFIIGIIALLYHVKRANERQFNFASLLLCWVICVSFMMSITNLEDTYRFVLFYPLPVVAAIGLFFALRHILPYLKRNLSTFFVKNNHLSKNWRSLIKYLVLILLCLLLLNSVFVRLNSNRYFTPYSLPSEELEAIQWIKEEYASQKTIFIMKPYGSSNNQSLPYYWQWATYYLIPEISNISIYMGDLSGLFSEVPSQKLPALMETTSYSKDLLSEYSVVLIDSKTIGTYYYRDVVEERILIQVHPFVYEVKDLSLQEIESWNTTWNYFVETGQIAPTEIAFEDSLFNSGWTPYQGSLVTNNSVATLTLDDGQTAMWIIKSGLSINSSEYNLLQIQADPHGGRIAIDFYDSEGEVIGRYWKFEYWNGSKTVTIKLDEILSGKTIYHLAINFISYNGASDCNINYLSIFTV